MEIEPERYDQPIQRLKNLDNSIYILGFLAFLPFTYAWYFALMTWISPQSTWYFLVLYMVIGFHIPVSFGLLFGLSSLILNSKVGKMDKGSGMRKAGLIMGILGFCFDVLYLGQYFILGVHMNESIGGGFRFILWFLSFTKWG
jgi:hypothetical protein